MLDENRHQPTVLAATFARTHVKYSHRKAALFGFFSNGSSVFESLWYGMFAAGSMLQPGHFPFVTAQQKRAVTASTTIAAYKAAYPGDAIVPLLEAAAKHSSLHELRDIRNVLSHRTAPGRTIQATIGGAVSEPDRWKLADIVLDDAATSSRRAQTSHLFSSMMDGFRVFALAHF